MIQTLRENNDLYFNPFSIVSSYDKNDTYLAIIDASISLISPSSLDFI